MVYLTLLLVAALFVFAYHYERNGNPIAWGQLFSRVFWSAAFAVGYVALAVPDVSWLTAGWFFIGSFIAILVPHAWAQNMGSWPTPQKRWPGFFLPTLTQMQWVDMGPALRTLYDFAGMFSVGLVRGLIVFAPLLFLGAGFISVLAAVFVTAISQPLSYLIGYQIPFNMWNNKPKSSEWGEFLVGLGWLAALSTYLWV